MADIGYGEGDTCAREGCCGVIDMHRSDNCSCHLSAPCGSCTAPRNFCPECDWEEANDPAPEPAPPTAAEQAAWKAARDTWKPRTLADLDGSKIDWIHVPSNSTCSMVKEGRCPPGTSADEVRKVVDGTFGGSFNSFDAERGYFKFTAYTD